MATPHGILTNKMFVPPLQLVVGRWWGSLSRGGGKGMGSTGCYLS